MGVRTFLALDIDEAARGALTAAGGRFPCDESKIRWVEPANLHVTVKFLGDVPEGGVREVCEAVAEAAGRMGAFDFDVRGLRCVPPGGKVRMVWAGVDEPTGRLAEAFGQLEAALEPLGFPRERRSFQPHITLACVKFAPSPAALRAAAERHAETQFGGQRAAEVVVYGSQLTPQGPIYTAIARGRMGGEAGR